MSEASRCDWSRSAASTSGRAGTRPQDAVAPGGRYRVDARFTNVSGQSLCGMSAAVLTLQGASE